MRKLLLTLVLPLLLLASQQGRVWHEMQHLGQAASAAAGTQGHSGDRGGDTGGKTQTADKLCESCLAFAQLGALAAGEPPARLPDSASAQALPPLQQAVVAGDAPAPRSRGPPPFH